MKKEQEGGGRSRCYKSKVRKTKVRYLEINWAVPNEGKHTIEINQAALCELKKGKEPRKGEKRGPCRHMTQPEGPGNPKTGRGGTDFEKKTKRRSVWARGKNLKSRGPEMRIWAH